MSTESNRATVASFWTAMYAHDWDDLGRFFTDDATYTDSPTPDDDIAVGPEQIVRRLRHGLDPISGHEHELGIVVAEGDNVATEHAETWIWHTGERVRLPFVSIHELRDGKIRRWTDYWDLQTLLGGAPQWWIEQIMTGWA